MRVLLLTEFFPSSSELRFSGGVEARTFYIAENLAKADKITVICRKTKNLKRTIKKGNILICPCGLPVFNISANFLSVFERLIFILASFWQGIKLDFDLVEGSNFVTYLPAYFLGLIKKKPKERLLSRKRKKTLETAKTKKTIRIIWIGRKIKFI